jgi:hypothetical protein
LKRFALADDREAIGKGCGREIPEFSIRAIP